jgi:thioredoxin-like negative regulator of GroEL
MKILNALTLMLSGVIIAACDVSPVTLQKAAVHKEAPFATVKDETLPQMVEFYSPYCSACKETARIVRDLAGRCDKSSVVLKIVDVSIESNEGLSQQYDIRALPTVLFLDELGTEVKRLEGLQTTNSIEHALFDLNGEGCDTLRAG